METHDVSSAGELSSPDVHVKSVSSSDIVPRSRRKRQRRTLERFEPSQTRPSYESSFQPSFSTAKLVIYSSSSDEYEETFITGDSDLPKYIFHHISKPPCCFSPEKSSSQEPNYSDPPTIPFSSLWTSVDPADPQYLTLKPPPKIIPYEEQLSNACSTALNSYNCTHKHHFELECCLYMEEITIPSDSLSPYPMSSCYHLSFVARSKDSGKLKLFFGEILNDTVVKACKVVAPGNPLFPLGCGVCHPKGVIYHPIGEHDIGGRRYYDSPRPWKLTERERAAKMLLGEMYVSENNVEALYPEEDSELRKITYGYALKALAWYERDTKRYELSRPLASVRFRDDKVRTCFLDCALYMHLNFMALSKDVSCTDASPDLFFAEINLDYSYVTTCINLTEVSGSLDSKLESSCMVCRKHCPMFHPMGEYRGIKYKAGLQGGTFADAQDECSSWGVRVQLHKKDEV